MTFDALLKIHTNSVKSVFTISNNVKQNHVHGLRPHKGNKKETRTDHDVHKNLPDCHTPALKQSHHIGKIPQLLRENPLHRFKN